MRRVSMRMHVRFIAENIHFFGPPYSIVFHEHVYVIDSHNSPIYITYCNYKLNFNLHTHTEWQRIRVKERNIYGSCRYIRKVNFIVCARLLLIVFCASVPLLLLSLFLKMSRVSVVCSIPHTCITCHSIPLSTRFVWLVYA